ncbi:sialidase family protein [Actinoplanes friuliensis]|uniref:Uncharacterized protein n=1 Tax=Actinoplanes friuliensis DSM 7358 TaxID=1246995 RepID=U5VRQ3_9ACTN|nr:sialidase family protein [Actinoplanes friuliensis]AGZ39628.1 hypothetical protein AFR_06695 [Actinoplanes friuliensis DSM 7358]
MPEQHFDGLRDYAGTASRQPDFAVVQQRARGVRRRRAVLTSVTAAAAVLVATGLGYATTNGQGDVSVSDPSPAPTETADPGGDWQPRMTNVVGGSATDLYGIYERCRECGPELYASADAGRTWKRRAEPPQTPQNADPRIPTITSLGQGLLAWHDGRILTPSDLDGTGKEVPATDGLWTSVDGGRTWKAAAVDTTPVSVLPPGTRPVDCVLADLKPPCKIYAVDPVTGRFAPLAAQPTGITIEEGWTNLTNVPPGDTVWIPGLDPQTRKPAVAVSADRGRTWRTHVFTDGVPAEADNGFTPTMYLPAIASGPDGLAYVLTYRKDLRMDPYRTTDGGVTWKRGQSTDETPDGGFVTADGAHVIKTGDRFLISTNGGDYEPVTLPGYPEELLELTQVTSRQATDLYVVSSEGDAYISGDGRTWRQAEGP